MKPSERHPSGRNGIDDHQRFLRGRIDKDISRLVPAAAIRKFQTLTAGTKRVTIPKSDCPKRTIRIVRAFQESFSFLLGDDHTPQITAVLR
jgi:hypothetical protein